ncbi:hypothetical protein B0T09DRAFT_252925 [Sordaria sp. MPI-SDFR-AT-0083]|nr:hypothetical protein B0T09DRAFT_252925 [Sordaria sp. MPI-SDFR-AT-0083]
MPFWKLVNKLLPALNREPARSGAQPDKRSTKSTTLKSSRSFSRICLLEPPPPLYEEATGPTTATTTTTTSSLGQLADTLFDRIFDTDGKDRLSKKDKSVLFVYYLLVDYGLDKTHNLCTYEALPQYRAEGPPAAACAMTNAIGNYAFMLALLHCSKQYNIAGGRLSLPVNEAVYAIRQHVKDQMVEDLVQGGRYKRGRHVMQQPVDDVAHDTFGLDCAVRFFEDGILGRYDTSEKTRDSIDTGELNGATVQKCWSLFMIVLAERATSSTSGDLLPPSGFNCYGDQSQAAMRGKSR